MSKKAVNTEDQAPSIIIDGAEKADTVKLFVTTTKGKKGITESAYDLWMSKASTLETQLVLTLLWETGIRIGEARMLPCANLWDRVLHVQKNKIKYKCKTCNNVKANHTMKKAGACQNYVEDYKPQFKDIEVSEKLFILLRAWIELGYNDFLPKGETHYKELLKSIHPDLKAHMFRRGMGIHYQQKGASDKIIGALLGHDGTQNVKYYSESVDAEANEFRRKVFNGEDTRKVYNISVDEYRKYNIEDMRKIMREEIRNMYDV